MESSAIYREEVLLEVLGRYFPKSKQVTRKYFDDMERKEAIRRRRQLQKQKKLVKFFGFHPDGDQMVFQQPFGLSYMSMPPDPDEEPLISKISINGPSSNIENVKKAEKLKGFFGNQLPDKQVQKQTLVEAGLDLLSTTSGDPGEPEAEEFIGQVNNLTEEERAVLKKRAKKLLTLLGSDLEGKPISPTVLVSQQRNSVAQRREMSEISIPGTSTSSMPADEAAKKAQKNKLEKLSSIMGERIGEEDLKVVEEEKHAARPLTQQEKKVVQIKNKRLERLFGSAIPAGNIINYSYLNQTEHNGSLGSLELNKSSVHNSTDSFGSIRAVVDDKKRALLRVRKLQKILGPEMTMANTSPTPNPNQKQ